MKVAFFLIAALAMAAPVFGRTMTRCSLAQEMYALGVPKSELPQWTCIAQKGSAYNTGVVGLKGNGTNDYGIFQINNYLYCQPPFGKFSYNECNVSCNDLLSDNIKDSVTCARQIQSQHGWTAWSFWKYCENDLTSIDDCF